MLIFRLLRRPASLPHVALASRHGFRLVRRLSRAAVEHRPTQDRRRPRELLPPRVVAKLIVIVEIFVAASNAEGALREQGALRMQPQLRTSRIGHVDVKSVDQPQLAVGLAEQQSPLEVTAPAENSARSVACHWK